ncbi:MAG: ABC transporter permease, partial [Acidobacteriota bacterium]
MAGRRSNRSPLWRLPVDREVDEEMRFHLDMRIREYRQQGLSAEEAERRALARFGDRARHAASCRLEAKVRNRRWSLGYWFDEMSQDVRFGVRQLRRRPWLALCLVGLLAVGLGSTAAVAVLLEQGLWQPPPFDTPQDLMTLWEHHTTRGKTKNSVGPANFLAWREETQTFSQMAGFITISVNLTGGEGPPQRLKARLGTEGYLDLLGAPPVLGRYFLAEDFIEGAESTVVLSQALWQQRFGGRRDIVGDQVAINGEALRVVGVASSAIHLDMGPAISPYGDAADVFLPLPESAGWRQPRGRWLMVLARVVPGVTVEAARADLAAVMDRQVERHARFNADWASQLVPLLEHLREPLRLPLLALFGAVSMLLLIVCLNASSLLFSRTLGRSTELAVRNALGAGRQRLARQLLVEGLVLVTAAGGLAWLLAGGILRLARATFPPELLPAYASGGRGIVWLVALALAGFCIMLFGLLPGLALSGRLSELAHAVSVGGSRRRQRLRSVLVFSQVALALMLLVGAGLMLRTVRGLLQVDPGFEGEGVV